LGLGKVENRFGGTYYLYDGGEDSFRKTGSKQIHERLSKYEKMERISLLELAIWRTSCLNAGSTKFDSIMQAMEDYLLARDEGSNSAEYKRECQIKSGADAIIQGVLPFLEECKPQLYHDLSQ